MIEMTLAKTLFLICFALGFAAALVLMLTVFSGFFLMRLWSLRDDLKDLKDALFALAKDDAPES